MTRTDTTWCSGRSMRARESRWDAIGTPLWYRMVQVWGSGRPKGVRVEGYDAGVGGSETAGEGVRGEPYAGGLQLCGERRFGYMVVVGWCG